MHGTIDVAFWLTFLFAAVLLLLPPGAPDGCSLKPPLVRSLERVQGAVPAAHPVAEGPGRGASRCAGAAASSRRAAAA